MAGGSRQRVAVLGAGIMGCCIAPLLARRGVEVVLFESEQALLPGASRWNEGKIHLGYLYSGDRGLHTARGLLTGGLLFRPLLEELLGAGLPDVTTSPDLYLVHNESIVSAADTAGYFAALTDLVREHPLAGHYPGDLRRAVTTRVPRAELDGMVDGARFQAGFATPEKSVCTRGVAGLLAAAVQAEPGILCRTGTEVLGASRDGNARRELFRVATADGVQGPFTAVVNALWAGRPAVDRSMSVDNLYKPSIRYRLSLFVDTEHDLSLPCAVICTGPFGDIKNYNGRRFYLSWYPGGLVYASDDTAVPDLSCIAAADRQRIADETFARLGDHIPAVAALRGQATSIAVEGGWVFANGRGSLSDPAASVHRRDKVGIHQSGGWFSVDTGKYSLAPWLAREVAGRILGR